MSAKRPLKDRFFANVRYNPSVIRTYTPKGGGPSTTVIRGCFEWTASLDTSGYGQIGDEFSKVRSAHRVRYRLETGLEIPDGLCICHHCDNRRCVTIAHLFLGTKRDNALDMKRKNRVAKGEKSGRAHVSDKEKERIVRAYETGAFTMQELADEVGVANSTISHWVNGKTRAS